MVLLLRVIRVGTGLAGICLGLALTLPGVAQQPIPGAEGERALEAKDFKGDERNTFNKLKEGGLDPTAQHRALLEKAAQWYVYRITWPQYQHKALPDSTDRLTLNDIVIDCLRQLPDRSKMVPKGDPRERQFRFLTEYGKAVTKACDEVLKNPMPIARVNAARILAHLGKAGPEEVGDTLVKVLEDKDQMDAVKVHILRGLKDLQQTVAVKAADGGWPGNTAGRFKDPEREERIVSALVKFMHRKMNLPKDASDEEKEAFRYVRREAVRALGAQRSPQLIVKKEIKAQPALELLRVVSKDGFTPEPSMSERIDAAVGVIQMQGGKSFNIDYVAFHVGHFLLDFANDFNNDKKFPNNLRSEPWHVQAARLRLALEEMAAANKSNANLDAFVKRARPLLESVEKDQIPSATPLLKTFLATKFKHEPTLFKGDEQSTVKLPMSEAE